uniref:Secreted protein n=1 Tax=Malurus cyaneus samueli TaxID=2593467 RepID=A0A8C5U706_9PASS
MCTTILILGPLVLMLRRRFCNKVEPYVLSCPTPVPLGSNWHLTSRLSQGREKQGSKQGRHVLASVCPAVPELPAAAAELNIH